jgi:toxin YhaV
LRQNGWLLLFDAHFEAQYKKLVEKVERAKHRLGDKVTESNHFKRLAAVDRLVYEVIPKDPAHKDFMLGSTLDGPYRSWRRAKFFQQYRLFFRFDTEAKVIIFSWFNDEDSLRAYGSKNDAYATFTKMLRKGKPPTTWQVLFDSLPK